MQTDIQIAAKDSIPHSSRAQKGFSGETDLPTGNAVMKQSVTEVHARVHPAPAKKWKAPVGYVPSAARLNFNPSSNADEMPKVDAPAVAPAKKWQAPEGYRPARKVDQADSKVEKKLNDGSFGMPTASITVTSQREEALRKMTQLKEEADAAHREAQAVFDRAIKTQVSLVVRSFCFSTYAYSHNMQEALGEIRGNFQAKLDAVASRANARLAQR